MLRERSEKEASKESTDIMKGEYIVGVVDSVDTVAGTAQVRIWQSGNRMLKDRPIHEIPTRLLTWYVSLDTFLFEFCGWNVFPPTVHHSTTCPHFYIIRFDWVVACVLWYVRGRF